MKEANQSKNQNTLSRQKINQLLDKTAKKILFTLACSSVFALLLIFAFIARESLPIFSTTTKTHNISEPDPNPATTTNHNNPNDSPLWHSLIFPHQSNSDDKPKYLWQPTDPIPKYNLIPLCINSIKISIIALLAAFPIALAAALYVSQLAPPKLREWTKPLIETLAGIPSVILGLFALTALAPLLQKTFDHAAQLNALIAGIALGLATIPLMFSIIEDALSNVPNTYRQAAYALGSTHWQAAYSIILPAARPGIVAAAILGFSRALGETMIVLMAAGEMGIISWNFLDPAQTITAAIASELNETAFGGEHSRILFLLGTLLFALTFTANLIGSHINHRLQTQPSTNNAQSIQPA